MRPLPQLTKAMPIFALTRRCYKYYSTHCSILFYSILFYSILFLFFCCSWTKPVLSGFSFRLPFLNKAGTRRMVFVSAFCFVAFDFCFDTVPGSTSIIWFNCTVCYHFILLYFTLIVYLNQLKGAYTKTTR